MVQNRVDGFIGDDHKLSNLPGKTKIYNLID